MTYITIYDPDVNPDRPRAVDLVRYRTAAHETEYLFDIRWYFRNQYLNKDAYEEHLLAAAPYPGIADEVAVEFALLLLTTLEPGWDTDHRTFNWHGDACEHSALLAHALEHPRHWNTVGGGMVRDTRSNRLVHVALRARGGRLAIVAFDPNRDEYVPLGYMARRLSPRGLTNTLFDMLPAISEHMSTTPRWPDWEVWGDEKAYAAIVDLPSKAYTAEAPHQRMVQEWMVDGKHAVDAAVECAKRDADNSENEES